MGMINPAGQYINVCMLIEIFLFNIRLYPFITIIITKKNNNNNKMGYLRMTQSFQYINISFSKH